MSKSNKRKLTLSVEDNLVKTLKVKAIQYDLSVSELVNNNSEELKIIKSKLKNSGEKLYITAPDINLNTDSEVFTNSEISITEEQIDLDSDNSEISIIEEQIDLDSDNNEITQ